MACVCARVGVASAERLTQRWCADMIRFKMLDQCRQFTSKAGSSSPKVLPQPTRPTRCMCQCDCYWALQSSLIHADLLRHNVRACAPRSPPALPCAGRHRRTRHAPQDNMVQPNPLTSPKFVQMDLSQVSNNPNK
jgi:hypothetical protein